MREWSLRRRLGARRKARLLRLIADFQRLIDQDATRADGWADVDKDNFRNYLRHVVAAVETRDPKPTEVAQAGDYLGLTRSLDNEGITSGFAPHLAVKIDFAWKRWYRSAEVAKEP